LAPRVAGAFFRDLSIGVNVQVRATIVWVHRWVGLSIAVLLLIEGLTGSILAFEGPIGDWLAAPPARAPSEARLPTLDFATLAMIAEGLEPNARVAYLPSSGPETAVLRCVPRIDRATGKPLSIGFTHIVLDARTGRDLGRLPGPVAAGRFGAQILPFVKRLHYNLAVGSPGTWALFLAAWAWTLDSVYSVALTVPTSMRRFWARWATAWRIKIPAGGYRVNMDLHRAGGLWFLIALVVFAWSSVQLEDHGDTYDSVMSALLPDYRRPTEAFDTWPRHDPAPLRLDWQAAQARGKELMAQRAQERGFRILAPAALVNFPENGVYNYEVVTDRRFPEPVRETIFFDGDTGAELHLAGFEFHWGNAVSDWLRALHMASDPIDYLLYRVLVCLFGLILSMLCLTGIVIWWKKHKARAVRQRTFGSHPGSGTSEIAS
jgi:uncharacterized iron-regulated membrane protein